MQEGLVRGALAIRGIGVVKGIATVLEKVGARLGKARIIIQNNFVLTRKDFAAMMIRSFVFAALLLAASGASAQQMVPARNGSCPSGSSHAGSGYCRSSSGAGFVAAHNGSCPSGTSHAGAGYCRTDGRTEYVPSRNGSCPSGTSHAGAGYCKGR